MTRIGTVADTVCTALAIGLLCGLLSSCVSTAPDPSAPPPDSEADREALIRLNAEVMRSQIVDRDAMPFSRMAIAEYRVLAPGGLIENREQSIAGLNAWNVRDITISGEEVVFHEPVALVVGRLDIDGEMQPVGRWGPLKFSSTWLRENGEWRLVSRSLTPCLPRLIEMGRC